jgi:protein-glutamine gamma-glutamyltransferase
MSLPPAQYGSVALQRYIDYYFEVGLYLLVLTSFGMLAATGGLDLPSCLLVAIALIVRGYLLGKRRSFFISERWTGPLSIAYFIFFGIDYFLFSHSFLSATIHLSLFGVVVRMFSLRRERDYLMLAILAFLMVLASAVLTVDSIFLFSFALFMLIAVATFMLMEMRRSGQTADVRARHSSDPKEHRHLAFALARIAPVMVATIVLFGGALFFVMPRISAGYLGGYSYGTNFSSGFSDHVQLGRIGEIQRSNAVVMHVQIDGDTVGRYDLHWRGVALADFDGRTWSTPHGQFPLRRDPEKGFVLPHRNPALNAYWTQAQAHENVIHYRVLMEPIGTNVFFVAPWARSVTGDYHLLGVDTGGALYNLDSAHTISRYEANSDIATPSASELRQAEHTYPPQISNQYLELRQVDPRVPKLAEQITHSAVNNYDRAAALETYLRGHFGYTLELPRTEPPDPIANFLFERKQGHCEYFASSMAVMLRTLGIPSRVVNGFHSDEFNDLTSNYIVRAKDAHSWVEAYFPGYGWQMFDPTPAGSGANANSLGRMELYLDAMSSFWRDWVVSYDTTHQVVIGQAAVSGTRGLWEGARVWARRKYRSMLRWARRSQDRVEHSPARWAIAGAVICLLLLLLANLRRLARWLHEKWLRSHPETSPEQAAAIWYERVTRILARRGVERTPAQTPQEFLKTIEDTRLREPVERFTGVYQSARFGNSVQDAKLLPELYEEVELAIKGN